MTWTDRILSGFSILVVIASVVLLVIATVVSAYEDPLRLLLSLATAMFGAHLALFYWLIGAVQQILRHQREAHHGRLD